MHFSTSHATYHLNVHHLASWLAPVQFLQEKCEIAEQQHFSLVSFYAYFWNTIFC